MLKDWAQKTNYPTWLVYETEATRNLLSSQETQGNYVPSSSDLQA